MISEGTRAVNSFVQESVGLRMNPLQIRLNGAYFAAFSVNRTTIALKIDKTCPRSAEFSLEFT